MGIEQECLEQECLECIAKDLRRINAEYISKREYDMAIKELEHSLSDRDYYNLRQRIEERIYRGLSFTGAMSCLVDALASRNQEEIEVFVEHSLAYSGQKS